MNDSKATVCPSTFTILLTKFWFWGIIREIDSVSLLGILEFANGVI